MPLAQASRAGLGRLLPSCVRGLQQTMPRLLSAAPSATPTPDIGGDRDDIVLQSFKQQQKAYRALLEGLKKIPVPLNSDKAAVSKFALEVEGLKKKVGLPEVDELVGATLNYKLRVAHGNVRKFLAAATEGVELGEYGDVVQLIYAAVEDIEAKTGAPLDASNEKGWAALQKRIETIQKEHGLDNYDKMKKESILEMYKDGLDRIREQAIEKMEQAKRRDGLEFIQVDLASLKPRIE